MIISGMGELHLDIVKDRLLREYKVETYLGPTLVAYRECIRKPSSIIDFTFDKWVIALVWFIELPVQCMGLGKLGVNIRVQISDHLQNHSKNTINASTSTTIICGHYIVSVTDP